MPATVKRPPALIGMSGEPISDGCRPAATELASLSSATSAVARCASMVCRLNCGWVATCVISRSCGIRCASYSTILYVAPLCTQCAAVRAMFGAIIVPEQKLPREPTMVTTLRPTLSALGVPPPTIAGAGAVAVSVNATARAGRREERPVIGGDQPCRAALVNRSQGLRQLVRFAIYVAGRTQ